jgi:hypothetical protein
MVHNLFAWAFEGELPLYFVKYQCFCPQSDAHCLVHAAFQDPLATAPLADHCFSLAVHNSQLVDHYVFYCIGCFELPTSQRKQPKTVGKFKCNTS